MLKLSGTLEVFQNNKGYVTDEVSKLILSVEYDLVDGYQCETLESVLEFKRRMGRPTDLKDIERIEAELKGV